MHSPRWPWLTLIACAAASANAVAQGTAPADAAAQPPESSAEPEREWRLPPLRLTGNLSYDMRVVRADNGGSSWANTATATVSTSTYIYQPWVALVNASVGVSGNWSKSDNNAFGGPGPQERVQSREAFITGNARVDLFPRSRFPAEVHWDRQDSRSSSGLFSPIGYTRQGIGMSMRYQPPDTSYSVAAAYDHRAESSGDLRQSQDSLSADFSRRWTHHDVNLGGSFSRARSNIADEESRFTSLVGRHSYAPSNVLSVSTTANITRSQALGLADSDMQVLQVSSVGFFHPDKAPYTITGSLRGLVMRDPANDLSNTSFGATLGSNYEISPKLRISASGGLNFAQAQDTQATSFTGGLSASYQGDTFQIRGFEYNWYSGASLGGSLANSTGMDAQTEQHGSINLGQSLHRTWPLSERSSVGLSASQSLSASVARSGGEVGAGGLGVSKSLLNNVSLQWQQNGDGHTAFARASYSDSMELGGARGRFQMFNVQVSGNMDLGYGRSINGDLGYQATQQRQGTAGVVGIDEVANARTRTSGVSGEIQFQQNTVFGVPRLRFVSRLRLAQDVLKQPGQIFSIPDRETRLWENRLDWNIGRLDAQLMLRMSEVDGNRVDSVWLRVNRAFGN